MRVLLLFPMTDGQTGPAIKHAFEQLGHNVKAVDAKRRPGISYNIALKFKPTLILCSKTAALARQVIAIKKKFPRIIICVWNVDTRSTIDHWKHLFPLIRACDYYFVVEYNLLEEWRKLNVRTHWLPQGLQDEIYGKPREITETDRRKYSCDICFAGGVGGGPVHNDRILFLEAIRQAGFKLNVWGSEGKPRIYNENHNKAVFLSKINLGISALPKNEKYASVRNYKILGAGGFLLELYRKGIYEIFPENIFDCYKSPDDLVEKIRYWLKNEQERKECAERGYKWVHENATYTHRIREALSYIKEL